MPKIDVEAPTETTFEGWNQEEKKSPETPDMIQKRLILQKLSPTSFSRREPQIRVDIVL